MCKCECGQPRGDISPTRPPNCDARVAGLVPVKTPAPTIARSCPSLQWYSPFLPLHQRLGLAQHPSRCCHSQPCPPQPCQRP
ncbi:hypothetical protein E2C01_047522 [Portunus trituberculatus]|uniref:Uncharacterized protein n=1 Tax=Portunus trituberculatus TaxID=210409 RepID=A0A5B7G1C4_PORTR|nr:hypothetical protein [Portunus trituberculatus]